jgi:hypothetical protein
VHRFANVLGMSRIGKLRSIFKEGVIVAHLLFDVEVYSKFDNYTRLAAHSNLGCSCRRISPILAHFILYFRWQF